MTFSQQQQSPKKVHDLQINLGFDTLIVSGCSFTYNYWSDRVETWPYVLRDLAGFNRVLDCSLPGAGNYHISNALRWGIDFDNIDAKNCLVIVMWSDTSRVDEIISSEHLQNNNIKQHRWYGKDDSSAVTAFSGGRQEWFWTNVKWQWFRDLQNIKTDKTMAVENYLYVVGLAEWLESRGFKFIFTDFVDYDLPSRSSTFDPAQYLPDHLARRYKSYFDPDLQTIYSYCVKKDLLQDDDFHPSPQGQSEWTKNILLPYLTKKYSV
jgi:hypothetical protein